MNTHSYPQYLIPQPHYNIINSKSIFENCFLIRTTPDQYYRDSPQSPIKGIQISNPSSNVLQYSLSIFGIFNTHEVKFIVKDDKEFPKGYHYDWIPRTNGIRPLPDHVNIDENKGCIFFNFGKLKILSPKFKYINEKVETLKPLILHKPTNCNYWHYEVTWVNEDNQDISILEGSWKKRAYSAIKTLLIDIASEIPPADYYMLKSEDYC